MNERMQDLVRKNADYWMNHYDRKSLSDMELLYKEVEKFAEVIVRECVDIVDKEVPGMVGVAAMKKIYEHFGVEE